MTSLKQAGYPNIETDEQTNKQTSKEENVKEVFDADMDAAVS